MLETLNPPISINNVEVLGFNKQDLELVVVFYVSKKDLPKKFPDGVNDMRIDMADLGLQTAVNKALSYMEKEGFIPPKKTWKVKAGLVINQNK